MWLQRVWPHYTSCKRSSLAANQENDWVQYSTIDLLNAWKDVPLFTLNDSQTSQYKDSKIKHKELLTDTIHLSKKVLWQSVLCLCTTPWKWAPWQHQGCWSCAKLQETAENIAISSLFDYMDHKHVHWLFFIALLNIIGGKGAISNINYHYNYLERISFMQLCIYPLFVKGKRNDIKKTLIGNSVLPLLTETD